MNLRRLAVFSSLVLVGSLCPYGSFAGQKYTPPPRSTPTFTNNTRPLPQSKPVPLPHDKPLRDHLAPSGPGAASKGKANVQQGQKGLLTPYFTKNAQGKKPPIPEKKTTTQGKKGSAGTQEAKVDRPMPFGGPNLRTPGRDARSDRQGTSAARGPSNR